MELRDILLFIRRNFRVLLVFAALGGLIGPLAFTLLPEKYVTEGTLYVGRTLVESGDFYTYSGYYNQATALSFTDTVRGIIEGREFHARVLENSGVEPTSKELRKFRSKYSARDKGPQLIEIEYRDKNKSKARDTWGVIVFETKKIAEKAATASDPQLKVTQLGEMPQTRKVEKSGLVFLAASSMLFLGLGVLYTAITEYMKGETKK
jgi:capsular polysaccharide biosynthesis protein